MWCLCWYAMPHFTQQAYSKALSNPSFSAVVALCRLIGFGSGCTSDPQEATLGRSDRELFEPRRRSVRRLRGLRLLRTNQPVHRPVTPAFLRVFRVLDPVAVRAEFGGAAVNR